MSDRRATDRRDWARRCDKRDAAFSIISRFLQRELKTVDVELIDAARDLAGKIAEQPWYSDDDIVVVE